jgi:hypothetical protein
MTRYRYDPIVLPCGIRTLQTLRQHQINQSNPSRIIAQYEGDPDEVPLVCMRYGEAPIMMTSGPYPPQSETQWSFTDPTVFYDGPTAEQALDTHRRFEPFPSRWITSTDGFMEDPFHDASGHPLKAHQDEMTGKREHIDLMEIPRDPNVAIIVPANGFPRDDLLCRGEWLVWWTE